LLMTWMFILGYTPFLTEGWHVRRTLWQWGQTPEPV
jgi:hypothetical protein